MAQSPADGQTGRFDIQIDFVGASWSAELQSAFLQAAERIESAVVGEAGSAAPGALVIQAELPAMDGPGGFFGFSVPTSLRADTLLPATAEMRFDAADAASLAAEGVWGEVVLHEMLHCLGFGTLWAAKGLLTPDGGGYVGAAGMAEYAAMGGAGPVPVETDGGAGTAGEHWSEAAFGDELMTGWIGAASPLSALSVASLADLGYVLAPREAWAADALYA